MRFIPGVQFKINSSIVPIRGSLLQNKMLKPREDEHFKRGQDYELTNISKSSDRRLLYYFTNHTAKTKFYIEFSTVAEADRKLEKLIGLDPIVYRDSED